MTYIYIYTFLFCSGDSRCEFRRLAAMAKGRRGRPRLSQKTSTIRDSVSPDVSPKAQDKSSGLTEQEQLECSDPQDSQLSNPPLVSSYASLVDPEDGTELRYVQTSCINGMKCAKLEKQDVNGEVEFWNSAIICSVLGANPPLQVIKGFIMRIWGTYDIDKIL